MRDAGERSMWFLWLLASMAVFWTVVALAACGSPEPRGMSWAVDQDGKPIPGSERAVLTASEAVELRQSPIFIGIQSAGDCAGNTNVYEGEIVGFRGAGFTSDCTWIQTGDHQVTGWGLDYVEIVRFWPSNQTMDNNTRSWKARAASWSPWTRSRVAWHGNTEGGGGVLCEVSMLPGGQETACHDYAATPWVSSVVVRKD